MRWPTLSIRSTVLAAIVAGVVLPAVLVLALDAHFARQAQQPMIERNRAAVLVLAAAVITEPAWTLDTTAVQAAMERILREPSVCRVEVLDLQPGTPAMAADADRCIDQRPMAPAQTEVLHEGQRVAVLRLWFDDTEIDRLLAERRGVTAWLVLAQVVFGVVVLAGVLSLRLLRPIGALKRQAGQLAAREPQPPPAWARGDELGQLGQHLNSVHGQIRSLIDELEDKNQALRRLAMYEPLTGLPNRTLLRELFVHAAAAARRDGRPMALLFVDLDHFKAVNDTHGHAAGDALLVGHQPPHARPRCASPTSSAAWAATSSWCCCQQVDGWDPVAATAERLVRTVADAAAAGGHRGAGARGGQHRHRPVPRRRRRLRRAGACRRRGHVPQQGAGPRPLQLLPRRHGHHAARAPGAGARAGRRHRTRPAACALPARGRPAQRPHQRLRGPGALAAPAARPAAARRLHHRGRRDRADRAAGPLGAGHRLRAAGAVARTRPRTACRWR